MHRPAGRREPRPLGKAPLALQRCVMVRRPRPRSPGPPSRCPCLSARRSLCSLLGVGTLALAWLAPALPRADPAEPAPRPAPTTDPDRTGADLFRRHCARCHEADGRGSSLRRRVPQAPDFTSPGWQYRHSDDQLVATILEGKGSEMPAFGAKLGKEEARAVAQHLRTFNSARTPREAGSQDDDFSKRFRELEAELDDLRKQYRQLSRPPAKQ